MKKIYYIGPIAALLLFGAYTWHFNKGYEQREAEKVAQIKAATEARMKAEAELRKKAIDEAMAVQNRLKKERAEKELAETKRKEARQLAIDTRDKYFREQEKLTRTVDRLKKEIRQEEDIVAKIDGSIKYQENEKKFQVTYVEKALKNVAALTDVLKQIDTAEAARSAAAAAAEEEKKNNS